MSKDSRLRGLALRIAFPLARLYWRVLKPRTFGVKAAIVRGADEAREILLVQASYGDRGLWNLPGGGYSPKRESPDRAVRRELREELGISGLELRELGIYRTEGEGKRDTVTIFFSVHGQETYTKYQLSAELESAGWFSLESVSNKSVEAARIARFAVDLLQKNGEVE